MATVNNQNAFRRVFGTADGSCAILAKLRRVLDLRAQRVGSRQAPFDNGWPSWGAHGPTNFLEH